MTTAVIALPEPVPNTRRSAVRMLLHDMRYGLTSAPRTPFPLTMALLFPLFFNLMFNLIQSGETIAGMPGVQFTTATIVVFVLCSSGYFNMANGVTIAREKGVLKRVRQTPMPKALHLLSRIGVSTVMSAASIALMLLVSAVAFGLQLRPLALVGLVLVFAVGSLASAVLGTAISRLIPTVEAAVVVSTSTMFPLMFISGVFFPIEGLPGPLDTALHALPFAPMADLVRALFDPAGTGLGIDPGSLAIVAAWGVAGLLLTLRFMKWEPRK